MTDFYLDSPLDLKRHPDDKSVLTFHGHEVLHTLIKCQFSPLDTTGQRYIITGSSDGNLHIFDLLSGDKALHLDVTDFMMVRLDDEDEIQVPCIRDVSWHP